MTTRILSTSPLVGVSLQELGQRFPDLCVAPYRSVAWRIELAKAEALVVLLSEPIREADLELAPNLKAIGTYSVGREPPAPAGRAKSAASGSSTPPGC